MKINQIAAGTSEVQRLLIYRMGSRLFAEGLKPPIRVIDDELKLPLPIGKPPVPKAVQDEMDVMRVLAESYRVNPGLHMTIADIRQFLDVTDEALFKHLETLEEKGWISQWINRKGQVELVKPTLTGIKETNPPEYYRFFPDWVPEEDMF